MAVIKLGPPLAGIRGTIGGVTYSANGSSLYAKAWARGANPQTPAQQVQRQNIATMPSLWNAMSDAERAAWRTFASDPAQELTNALGETYYASGYNWFVKCNTRLSRVGRSPITAVPTQARPAAPTITDFRVTVAGTDPNIATGGTASASSTDASSSAANAFDSNPSTGWFTAFGVTTGWLQYVLPSPAVVRGYTLTAWAPSDLNPMDWTFERLDAGPTWTPIDTVTGIVMTTPNTYTFYCANDTASTTYRLNVSANNGNANRLGLREMTYLAAEEDASVIIYPDGDFVASPDYDLVLHIAQGATAARAFQYPGYHQVLAQQDPDGTYATFQAELTALAGVISLDRSWFARLFRQTQEGLRSAAQTATAVTE